MNFFPHKNFPHQLFVMSTVLGMAICAQAASLKTAIDPNAEKVIARSVQTYQSLRSYQDEAALVSNSPAGKEVAHQTISFQAPRFLNVTTTSGKQHLIENYDGVLDNSTHTDDSGPYVSREPLPDVSYGRKVLLQYQPMGPLFTAFLAGVNPIGNPFGWQISELKLGHPALLGGAKVDAITLTMRDDPKTHITYLIGQADHLVRRITLNSITLMGDKYSMDETHSNIKTNITFPAGTFTFHAPANTPVKNPMDDARGGAFGVGQIPGPIHAQDLHKKTVTLDQYKGKVLLLDFWASWCVPCRMEMPYVKALYQKYHSQGLEIVGISQDTKLTDLQKYLAQEALPWRQIFDQGDNLKISGDYNIMGIPSNVIIGRDGKVAAVNQDYLLLDSAIRTALAEKK